MRSSRPFAIVPVALAALAALAACSEEKITSTNRPPLAGVRYIHAVNDTARLDFRMVDQLEYSANTIAGQGGILFREGTEYFPVEAKARRITVFSLADTLLTTVQQAVHDTTITFEANKNYTLLFTGSARANTDRFMVIEEAPPATVAATQVAVRVFNASPAPVSAYLVPTATTAISGAPAIATVGAMSASQYVARDTGNIAIRVTAAGSTTALASLAAARGTLGTAAINPVAGSAVPGTVFSAYVFPASVAGSRAPQTAAFLTTGVQLFVDRLPANTIAP
jgi:hypothetical protein